MMRSMSGLGALGLACAGVLVEAAPASACGETPCAQRVQSIPQGTALPVPTNAELRIEYKGFVEPEAAGIDCSIPLTEVRLTAVGGEPSDVEAEMLQDGGDYPSTWMVARPTALEPNTEYVVTSLHEGSGQCGCEAPSYFEVMRFMTAGGPDEEAPLAPEPFGTSSTTAQISDNTCGTFHQFSFSFDVEAPQDGSLMTRYNVYADGELVRHYVEPGSTQVVVDCLEDSARPGKFVAEATEFSLRAVDIAGNESEHSTTIAISDPCAVDIAPGDADASVDSAPDAGAFEQDGGAAIETDAGEPSRPVVAALKPEGRGTEDCSASGASNGVSTAAWIALALAFSRRSRRR